jgi:hypothetical protein
MPRYQYRVVPFIGSIKSGQAAGEVAQQLESAINQQVAQGWEFWTFYDGNIQVQTGCIAGLMGAKASYMAYDQLVFRREA